MSQQKPKQPFLKKGTRQFLSNAQTRSQSQKPRIVQFTNQEDNHGYQLAVNPFSNKNSQKQMPKEQIKISVNLKNKSLQKKISQKKPPINKNIKSNQNIQETNASLNKKQKKQSEQQFPHSKDSGKKKPTLLSDYLNSQNSTKKVANPSNKFNDYIMNQTNLKNTTNKFSNKIPENSNRIQSKAHTLLKQNQQDFEDEQHQNYKDQLVNHDSDENEFIDIDNSKTKVSNFNGFKNKYENYSNPLLKEIVRQKQEKQNQLNKINHNLTKNSLVQKKQDYKKEQEDIKIDSDSEEEFKIPKNKFNLANQKLKSTSKNKKAFQERIFAQEDQDQQSCPNKKQKEVSIQNNKPSKLTQKLWKKGETANVQKQKIEKQIKQIKKISIEDIPEDLKQQIILKYFAEKKKEAQEIKAKMYQQMKLIQKKQSILKEEERNLEKRQKQFEKSIQEKNKEHQAKRKEDLSKINRQKMYLKDHQTNKPDWKTKNQIEVLKTQLNQQKEDRKKLQTKLKGQIDRLKTKLQKQEEKNKILTQKIKLIQLAQLQQKKKIKDQQLLQNKQKKIQKANYWSDAPLTSKLQRLLEKQFTLIEFSEQFYHYSNNQFYKYYEIKGQGDQMISQQTVKDRIQRKYSNGKIQIQSIQKYIKQIFPWNYTILQFVNGDIKQTIILKKEGLKQLKLQIYFDSRQEIVQFTISPQRTIHYFIQRQQIEMNDQRLKCKQIYIGNRLVRQYANGNQETYERNKEGKIYRVY